MAGGTRRWYVDGPVPRISCEGPHGRNVVEVSLVMLRFRPLFELTARVAEPDVVPDGPYGIRRYIAVTGGRFAGERISGVLLPRGADCQLVRPDAVAELDVRVTLRTDDGVVIFMKGQGIRHAVPEVAARMAAGEAVDRAEYYFREAMQFEAPPCAYAWLNRIIAVGIGERLPDTVRLESFEIL